MEQTSLICITKQSKANACRNAQTRQTKERLDLKSDDSVLLSNIIIIINGWTFKLMTD